MQKYFNTPYRRQLQVELETKTKAYREADKYWGFCETNPFYGGRPYTSEIIPKYGKHPEETIRESNEDLQMTIKKIVDEGIPVTVCLEVTRQIISPFSQPYKI